jgi:hypothetical protein
MVSGIPFRVVVTARRVEGEPWAQIMRSAAVYKGQYRIDNRVGEERIKKPIPHNLPPLPKTPLTGST